MKVVYLINGLNGGGAAFPMIQVIGLIRELGHDVRVFALLPQDGRAAELLERAGIPYEILGSGPTDVLLPFARLIRRLQRDRADLLWTSLTRGTLYGQIAGHLLGIPVVSWQHSDYLKPANLAILRHTRPLTSRWIADSEAVRGFAEGTLGVPSERVTVWPPFIANPDAPVSRVWDGQGPIRLGTLGRLHHSKQYAVLLRAFARARIIDAPACARLELHLAGDGPEHAALKALGTELGLNGVLHFHGFVAPEVFLAHLHGYAQTSLKEGFCIAAHEAMQAGLPIIATRVGELARGVTPGQTGWLCNIGDVEAIAQAVLSLARNPTHASTMGHLARAQVLERYSRERFRTVGERLVAEIASDITAQSRSKEASRSASSSVQ